MKPILTVVSAGGHLTQALCVMTAIEEFHIVTSVEITTDVGAKSVRVIKNTQFNPFIHLYNLFSAIYIILKVRPYAVFSTGGPICLPFAVVSKVFRIKFIYLDTLSRVQDLSNTAKFLHKYKLATEMYCQWESLIKKYSGVKYHGKTFNICNDWD